MFVTVEFPNPAPRQHMQSEAGMPGLRTPPTAGKIKDLRVLASFMCQFGRAGYLVPESIVVEPVDS